MMCFSKKAMDTMFKCIHIGPVGQCMWQDLAMGRERGWKFCQHIALDHYWSLASVVYEKFVRHRNAAEDEFDCIQVYFLTARACCVWCWNQDMGVWRKDNRLVQ